MQKLGVKKYECFQHQICFRSEAKWSAHMEECASLLRDGFICTGLKKSGDMCKVELRSASELIHHMHSEHQLYLCDKSGSKHADLDDFKSHSHTHQCTIFSKLFDIVFSFIIKAKKSTFSVPVRCTLCSANASTVARYKAHFKAKQRVINDYYK